MTGLLLVLALFAPVIVLLACLAPARRKHLPALLWLAPLPALIAALTASGSAIRLPASLLRLTLALDAPGALLLGVCALLWSAGGLTAAFWLRGKPDAFRFTVWWLLTLTGSIGVFIAADLVTFYLVYALVSLPAYGLVAYEGTPGARRAGAVYVALALLGEAFLLLAFVLLAQAEPDNSLLIADGVAALPGSPFQGLTIALLLLGFALKMGLVPFHVWMPLTYTATPIPAAAVLSGAAVKAGVIGLIRFLPFGIALPGWGEALTAIGFLSAFYGVALGITQSNPKTILAYSSISQMGVIAAVSGMGLMSGDAAAVIGIAFYAAHHVLVKGGLFLAIGAVGKRGLWPVLLPAAIIALGIAGLPLTGGYLAKLAVKDLLGKGVVGLLGALSGAASTLLMLHFLSRLALLQSGRSVPERTVQIWLATAFAAVFVPWLVYLTLWGGADVLSAYALSSAIWPMLLGFALAYALRRWGSALPRVPPGDIIVFAAPAVAAAWKSTAAIERLDYRLRAWPVAGISLLALVILLGVALIAG